METKVSIARCGIIDDKRSVDDALSNSLELLGGIGEKIGDKSRVLIKPNILVDADFRSGATTNPYLIEALIDLLKKFDCRITIAEGAVVGVDTMKAFRGCGIDRLAKKTGVDLVDLKKDDFKKIDIPGAKELKELKIPKTVLESDFIINIPVLKTHDSFPATLGLKNIKGVIAEEDKKKFHNRELGQCIVDLNKVVKSDLSIMDGTVGMEGLGPIYGEPVDLKIIISSFDLVAADIVASRIMGIDPYSIDYIKLAIEQDVSGIDEKDISVVGEKIRDVKKKFRLIDLESSAYKKHLIRVLDDKACSGCMHTLESFLYKIDKRGQLGQLRGKTFLLGKVDTPDGISGEKKIRFGKCARGLDLYGSYYIPGCPPHMDTIRDVLNIKKK